MPSGITRIDENTIEVTNTTTVTKTLNKNALETQLLEVLSALPAVDTVKETLIKRQRELEALLLVFKDNQVEVENGI